MNSKTLNALSALCLAAVIGTMSWRDMHPKTAGSPTALTQLITYHVGSDITAEMFPDDSLPLTIAQGAFSYGADGKMIWKAKGLAPMTIAQRQINLSFTFNSLPKNPAPTINKISAVADAWVRKGDTVATLVFDYSADKPDFKGYAALLAAAQGAFNNVRTGFGIFPGINVQWATGPQKDALYSMQVNSAPFLIHVPPAGLTPEFFSALMVVKHNFILQFPAGIQLADLDKAALKKLDFLTGVTLTLDPRKPMPKHDEKIGLFPKL